MSKISTPIRMLLLEDDANLRGILAEVLTHAGYEVVAAADGPEALAKAPDHDFEVLIFDVKLPGVDGLDTLSRFKAVDPDILSVIITGFATEQDTLRALRLGVGDYLNKPFSMEDFLDSIRRVAELALKRREDRNREFSTLSLAQWSLGALAANLDFSEPCSGYGRFESVQIARDYVREVGHGRDVQQDMVVALFCTLLKSSTRRSPQERELLELLPRRISSLLEEIAQVQEIDDGLASLGTLCLRLVHDRGALEQLQERHGLLGKTESAGRRSKYFLGLAYSLLAAGDTAAAEEAFENVTALADSNRSGQAWLELAKVSGKRGQQAESRSRLRELVKLLPAMSPQARADLEIEAGMAALQLGFAEGTELLKRGGVRIAQLGGLGDSSQVKVALRASDGDSVEDAEFDAALQYLSKQANIHRLMRVGDWLLPRLLGEWVEERKENLKVLIQRMIQDSPRATARLLSEETPKEDLQAFLTFLVQVTGPIHVERLEWLAGHHTSSEAKALASQLLAQEYKASIPTIRVLSLGTCQVWLGDQLIAQGLWKTAKSRFLLAALVDKSGNSIPQDQLIEQFWPGGAAGKGRRSLTQAVSELRKVLQAAGMPETVDPVQRKHNVIFLEPDVKIWSDLESFRENLRSGSQALEQGEFRQALRHLREAAVLVRGPYLEDCRLEWAEIVRRQFEREVTECLGLLARCNKDLGFLPEALEVSRQLLEVTPYHLAVHEQVMEIHLKSRRPDLAIQHFQEIRRELDEDMELEPSTELLKLYEEAKLAL